MSLTILNTILDEEIRSPTNAADEHDAQVTTFDLSAFKTSLNAIAGLTFVTSPSGFPQFAERTDFVDFTNPVTDLFLTSSGTGTPFPASGTATTLKVGDTTIFLFPTSNPDIVVGRLGTENGATDTANPGGDIALVIGIEETKANGFVTSADMWIALYAPITHNGANLVDSADQLDLSGLVYLGSDFDTTEQVPFENFDGVPSGNNLFNVIFPSDGSTAVQLLLTGSAGEALSTVNVSTTGIGSGSQHINVGATLRIDTVQGMTKGSVDSAPEVNQSSNIVYADTNADADSDARVELVGADFEITQINPGSANERVDIRIQAFNAVGQAQQSAYLTDAIASDGVAVTIDVADVIVLNGAGQDITASLTITQDGDSVLIGGLDDGTAGSKTDGYQVFFTTAGVRFDRFLITNVDTTTTFDVGNIHVTAVQGGEDTEFAELGSHLKFQDDGPLITASNASLTALTVDESALLTNASGSFAGLFNTPDAGADAPASVAYTLGVSATGAVSGLIDTASGDGVFLFLQGGKVVGRAGDNATLAATGDVVFEISIAANGTVTLDQQRAVVHTDTNDHDSTSPAMTASLITLTATVSDSEPDATDDSASALVGIGDKFLFKDDGPVIGASPNANAPNNLVVKNLPNDAAGTDSSSYVLTPGADGLKGFTIIGPADNSGDFQWTYNANTTSAITGTYKGQNLYSLIVNSDGTYTFDMTGSIPGTSLPLSSEEIKAGGPNSNSIDVGILGTDPRFVNIAATGGPINESNDNVGVTNGNLDTGEALTFTLFDGATQLSFLGISIGTKSASGGTYGWTAHVVGGGTITGPDEIVSKNGLIVISPSDLGGALIDSITITKEGGSTTKIGIDDIDILLPPSDFTLNFGVRLTDRDNDFADQSFTVSIDGNNDGAITNPASALSVPAGAELAELSIAEVDSVAMLRSYSYHHDFFLM